MAQDIDQAGADSARTGEPAPIPDLDLYRLAWETPEFSADPYPRFEVARARHPWLATVNGLSRP